MKTSQLANNSEGNTAWKWTGGSPKEKSSAKTRSVSETEGKANALTYATEANFTPAVFRRIG